MKGSSLLCWRYFMKSESNLLNYIYWLMSCCKIILFCVNIKTRGCTSSYIINFLLMCHLPRLLLILSLLIPKVHPVMVMTMWVTLIVFSRIIGIVLRHHSDYWTLLSSLVTKVTLLHCQITATLVCTFCVVLEHTVDFCVRYDTIMAALEFIYTAVVC